VCVQGVVQEAGTGRDVDIVPADVREALADRPETDGLWLGVTLLGKVCSMDDSGESQESSILGETLIDELLEGTATTLVLVGIPGARRIEADGGFAPLNLRDLLGLDEEDLAMRIEEAANEPRRGRAVDVDAAAGHPSHALSIVALVLIVSIALYSVPLEFGLSY
jgi:hypothetical protein